MTLAARVRLVAIENPHGNVAPVIDYIKCGSTRWEEIFERSARHAHLVTIVADEDSPGLRKELTWLMEHALAKTWLIAARQFVPELERIVPKFREVAWLTVLDGPLRYISSIGTPSGLISYLDQNAREQRL
jgi:hypothetical protein